MEFHQIVRGEALHDSAWHALKSPIRWFFGASSHTVQEQALGAGGSDTGIHQLLCGVGGSGLFQWHTPGHCGQHLSLLCHRQGYTEHHKA